MHMNLNVTRSCYQQTLQVSCFPILIDVLENLHRSLLPPAEYMIRTIPKEEFAGKRGPLTNSGMGGNA